MPSRLGFLCCYLFCRPPRTPYPPAVGCGCPVPRRWWLTFVFVFQLLTHPVPCRYNMHPPTLIPFIEIIPIIFRGQLAVFQSVSRKCIIECDHLVEGCFFVRSVDVTCGLNGTQRGAALPTDRASIHITRQHKAPLGPATGSSIGTTNGPP